MEWMVDQKFWAWKQRELRTGKPQGQAERILLQRELREMWLNSIRERKIEIVSTVALDKIEGNAILDRDLSRSAHCSQSHVAVLIFPWSRICDARYVSSRQFHVILHSRVCEGMVRTLLDLSVQ
jgi:hypothetical protein